jgi:phosphoglycolate phosphatase-like HAD superfamily hydrolase
MSQAAPKIVFFDWNKTLSHSRFWEQLEDARHPHYEDGKKIFKFLFQDNRSMLNPWMRGELTTDKVLDAISLGTGVSKDILEKELAESCRNMRFAFEELPEMIGELKKRGMRCVIATDNMDTFRKYTIPGMKLEELFDDFLVSCELGVLKFDKGENAESIPFFDSFLKERGLGYDQVVLLDDCTDDGTYAKRGFRIWKNTSPEEFRVQCEKLIRGEYET